MGKNKRNNKKKAAQKPQEPVKKKRLIKRRDFIIMCAATVAGLSIGGKEIYDRYFGSWNFLYRTVEDINLGVLKADKIISNFVPFGELENIISSESDLGIALLNNKQILKEIEEEVRKKGYSTTEYEVTFSENLFGVPSPRRITNSIISYCRKAIDFMYEQLPSLDKHNFEFVPLEKGKNYTQDFNSKIFIGDMNYKVIKSKARNKKNNNQVVELDSHVIGQIGCSSRPIVRKSTLTLESWHSFFGAYNIALFAPFSELIPLTTIKATTKYEFSSEEIDHVTALQADETICEALSHVLAYKLVDKLNIPNGKQTINEIDRVTFKNPMYQHVPAAIRWINKHGMKAALECYMNSPADFMKRIKRA